MINLKFQCVGRNESLQNGQKGVQINFQPFAEQPDSTHNIGAAIGTPNTSTTSQAAPVPNAVQITATAFGVYFIGDSDEASQFVLGGIYDFTLGNTKSK